ESDKKMETKKIMATFAILMIALGIAGFAYAHWSKVVTVDGTVTTGTLHVVPSFHVEYTEAENKTVAVIGSEVNATANHIDIWLNNVYPCLNVSGYIDLENTGTIPVNLVGIDIMGTEGVYAVWNENMKYWEIWQALPDNGGAVLIATGNYTFRFPDGYPQIDPESTAYIDFWIHFEEGLPQDASYSFTITLTFWNWNESPGPS
ncbi:MAG: hypothetical protein ACPLW8_04305, partial [Candidatus Bathyarchaeales archaeon]